nr:PAS domain-containing protein [Desulfurispira natronophila]
MLTLGLLGIGLAFAATARAISRPINKLVENVDQVERDQSLNARVSLQGPRELQELARHFNQTLDAFEFMARSREELDYILDGSPAIVWSYDVSTLQIHYVSRNISNVLGYKTEEAVAAGWIEECIHPEDLKDVISQLQTWVDQGAAATLEITYRFRHADGHWVWLGEVTRAVLASDGTISEAISTTLDITSRRQMEMELEHSRQRLEEAQRIAHLGHWEANLHTNELWWSDAIYEMLGHDLQTYTPSVEAFKEAVHPDDLPDVIASEKLAEQTGVLDVEHRIVLPDGRVRWLHELARAEEDAQGNRVRLIGTVQDITQRKEQQQLLESAFKAARSVSFIITDLQTNIEEFSPGAETIFGYSRDEVLNTPVAKLHESQEAERFGEYLDQLHRSGKGFTIETRLVRKNGEIFPAIFSLEPIFDDRGQLCRTIGVSIDISERKELEESLNQSLERLIQAQRTARLGHWETDLATGELWWSSMVYELFGLDPAEPITLERFQQQVHPDDLPGLLAAEENAIQTGSMEVKYRFQHAQSGELRWAREIAHPSVHEDGSRKLVGTVQDITEHQQLLAQLQESQLHFQQFAENSETVFWVRTREQVLYVSPAYEKVWGRPRQSLLDNVGSLIETVHPDDQRRFVLHMQRELDGGQSFDGVYRIVRPEGTVRWIHARSFPVFDADGNVECWTGVAEDVTAQKEHEDTLEEFNTKLMLQVEQEVMNRMSTEQSYRTLVEHSPEGVLLLDSSGCFVSCNPAAAAMLGLTPREVIGKRPEDFSGNGRELYPTVEQVISRALGGEVQQRFNWTMQHISGHELLLETIVSPLGLDQPEHLLVLCRDNTEINRLQQEKQLQEATLIQQTKMAELGNMMGAIAHQWKQPLNNIALYTQFLPEDYEQGMLDKERLDETSERILRLVNFMSTTIDDFRNFFKPSTEESAFELCETVKSVVEIIRGQLIKDTVDINIETCEPTYVWGLHSQFQQVILNIINNARQALLEKRSSQREVTVNFSHEEGYVLVHISDNAGGIPEDLLPDKIFQPFISTKGEEGTGIGLSLGQTIIEKMGGTICAHNTESGACFTLRLPVKRI